MGSHNTYRSADKSLARPTFRCILFDGETISFDASLVTYTSKDVPRQAETALGVPGRLRPRIISTFGTTRVVGRQPCEPAAFTPGEIPDTHFQRLSRPQGTWFCRKEETE